MEQKGGNWPGPTTTHRDADKRKGLWEERGLHPSVREGVGRTPGVGQTSSGQPTVEFEDLRGTSKRFLCPLPCLGCTCRVSARRLDFLFLYPFLLLWRSCPTPVCSLLSTKSHAQHTSVAIDSL